MQVHFFHVIGLLAWFQTVFLGVSLANSRQGSRLSRRLFVSMLWIFAIQIAYSFTHSLGMGAVFYPYFKWLHILAQAGFLIGPLLFLYIRALLTLNMTLSSRDCWHGAVFAVMMINAVLAAFSLPHISLWHAGDRQFFSLTLLIHEALYVIWIVVLMKRHHVKPYALVVRNGLGLPPGLRLFILTFMVVWQVKLQIFVFINVYRLWQFCPYGESLFFLTVFMFINLLALLAVRRPEWIYPPQRNALKQLDKKEILRCRTQLLSLMMKERLYRDPGLTLPQLARRLEMSPRQLSQFISAEFSHNFCDFLNGYRVDEARAMLEETDTDRRVLEVAYEVGFNSKSAFNRAFKIKTGLTPTAYRTQAMGH